MAKNHRIKFDEFLKSAFLDLVRQGIGRSNACVKVGITRATLSAHIERYPKFSEKLHLAEMDANELVEMALFRTAIGGNVTAQQVWLYNRDPERWSDKRNSQLDVKKFEFEINDFRKLQAEVEELKERLKKE